METINIFCREVYGVLLLHLITPYTHLHFMSICYPSLLYLTSIFVLKYIYQLKFLYTIFEEVLLTLESYVHMQAKE